MVFTIITYYNHVRRHLYGVYHHNLLEGTSMVFTITTSITSLLEGTSIVFTMTTFRRHLYGVCHHNLLQAC